MSKTKRRLEKDYLNSNPLLLRIQKLEQKIKELETIVKEKDPPL